MNIFKAALVLSLLILSTSLFSQDSKPMSVKEKKEHFLSIIVPAVDEIYDELQHQYIDILDHHHDPIYEEDILKLKKVYKVETNEELLTALKPHPKSIAIAQAAMESAWGTSRLFREANNIFGVWSVNPSEPRIAANQKRGTKTIWLKKYNIAQDSIRDYYKTLGRSGAYKEFRKVKMQTDDPYKIVKELNHYSERGDDYCKELSSMIKYNKFYLYDKK